MPSYASIRRKATRALNRYGQAFTFRRIVPTAALDPTKPSVVPAHNPASDIVRPDAAHPTVLKLFWEEIGDISPTEGAESVRAAWLPIFDIRPQHGDFIEVPGDSWQIVSDPMPLAPGGTDTMWKVMLRKWPTMSQLPTT